MLLSSPKCFRHRFRKTRCWPSTSCNIVVNHVTLCCGRWIVPLTESITHLNRIFCVAHVLSPCFIFFSDAGSWRVVRSVGKRGCSTSTSECNRACFTSSRLALFPCVIPRKSSTKISKKARAPLDSTTRFWLMSRCPDIGLSRPGTVDSNTWSSQYSVRSRGVSSLNAMLVRSAMVSVTAQNCGGDSTQPIRRTRRNATRVLPSGPRGRQTPREGTSSGARPTQLIKHAS